jgi:4-amino-4-deoxy-L-arabinose transferase-like glycosyltransferase
MANPTASNPPSRASFWADLAFLALGLALLLGPHLGSRALWEPDEGRYAEIPREMVASGDFVTPRLNGVKYFEKPPLFYWTEAVSLKLFGHDEAALRLPLALLAFLGCAAVYTAGRRLFGRGAGLFAAGVLATCPLYFGLANVISLDLPVSVFLTVALLAFLVAAHEPPGWGRRWSLWTFFAAAALAVLTKGLIGLVIPGAILVLWIVAFRQWRLLKLAFAPTGILLFLALALPWHLLVARANSDWAWFYFVHEHFERYLSKVHDRYEPVWYFLPVILGGMLPWTVFLVRAVKDAFRAMGEERRATVFLLLWASFVLFFFSLSDSKLVPYILPAVPPLALLIGRSLAAAWARPAGSRLGIAYGALLAVGVTLAVPFLAPALAGPKAAPAVALLGGWVPAAGVTLLLLGVVPFALDRLGRRRAALASLGVAACLLLFVLAGGAARFDARRSVKPLALALRELLQPGDEVVNYGEYYQDLPFYLGRTITVAHYRGELEFGITAEDTRGWMIDPAEFWRRWRGPGRVYLVTDFRKGLTPEAVGGKLLARSGDDRLLVNR